LVAGGERPKSSESFWPGTKEARRFDVDVGVGGGECSLAMVKAQRPRRVREVERKSKVKAKVKGGEGGLIDGEKGLRSL